MDTILLINDSPTLTKVLTAHFRRVGYQVIAVDAALKAYEQFIRHEVHLILTDYFLADDDGLSVIETLRARKNHEDLPIVVFTAMDDEATVEECRAAGASLVLSKSSATQDILDRIENLIHDYKASLPSSSIDTDMGQSIVKATCEVFRAMMNMKVSAGEIQVEKARNRKAEVIGSIGVAGFLSGSISVFLDRGFAAEAASSLLMLDDPSELGDEDLVDAIGELTNMIGGNIKTELFHKTPLFDISVPSVYVGEDLQRRTVSEDLCFLVPFTCGESTFSVEFLMITRNDDEGTTGVQAALVAGLAAQGARGEPQPETGGTGG